MFDFARSVHEQAPIDVYVDVADLGASRVDTAAHGVRAAVAGRRASDGRERAALHVAPPRQRARGRLVMLPRLRALDPLIPRIRRRWAWILPMLHRRFPLDSIAPVRLVRVPLVYRMEVLERMRVFGQFGRDPPR